MANNPINARLDIFKSFLKTDAEKAFVTLFNDHAGDWNKIADSLSDNALLKDKATNLRFINAMAGFSSEHLPLVKAFVDNPKTNSLRDIALHFGKNELLDLVAKTGVPTSFGAPSAEGKTVVGEDLAVQQAQYVQALQHKLFAEVPTAVVQRMVGTPTETPISDPILRGGISTFLNNQDEAFNIKTTSIYTAFKAENAFEGIAPELQEGLKTELKTLQRVAAISPVAEAIPVLMKAKMHTAYQVSEMPEKQFIQAFKDQLGEDGEGIAKQMYTNAVNSRIQNEHALIALKEARQGTGIAFIDKSLNRKTKTSEDLSDRSINTLLPTPPPTANPLEKHNLSWDLLFGDADVCECGECTSVYSAASYFVELMQYLRNNNLDPNNPNIVSTTDANGNPIKKGKAGYIGTPLEKLIDRRPDLNCLELTCANTNTILPYVDLVNEVMENYVVFKHPKPFNVADETSAELLAAPQHTEYQAYCILKDEVYPFTLPYHQPIDQIRIDLDFLGTSRKELIDTFRSPREATPSITDPVVLTVLDTLHQDYLNRAVTAECLGLTQEEYVILTKEAFVCKEYWDKQCQVVHTQEEYLTKIGVKPVHKYYGYDTEGDMLDATTEKGSTYVKKQFLPRTGIEYVDLVELLKTQCLNPNMPRGKALFIAENLHFSYRFLQNFKKAEGEDKLIELLINSENYLSIYPELKDLPTFFNFDKKGTAPICPVADDEFDITKDDIKHWIKCHFERIGNMIVLENGGKCSCIGGDFLTQDNGITKFSINSKCDVLRGGGIVGKYNCSTGEVTLNDTNYWQELGRYKFVGNNGSGVGHWDKQKLLNANNNPFSTNSQAKDTCDLDTVRLIHLNGESVTVKEYDHIHRFIRLWRKMGWTIDEIDNSLMGLSAAKGNCLDAAMPNTGGCTDCNDLFDSSTGCKDCANEEDCDGQALTSHCDITPAYLHQLCAVKHLLEKTGLELTKLLTFWTNISTSGEKSLYKRLFLTHNLSGMDTVFKADKNGNYLLADEKISDHKPVIMAAFNLSSDDIDAIMAQSQIEDKLTLTNLSLMYRYRLLSKALGLKIPAFIEVLPLFGDPFTDAVTTLDFMERWGKMEDAGFNYRQLNYIIRDVDDTKKPLAPTEKAILQLAKTIYDGLNAIEEAHKNLAANPKAIDPVLDIQAQATTDFVRSKAALLFDPTVVEQILGILEGTSVFITNAPVGLLAVSDKLNPQKDDPNVPPSEVLTALRKKVKYNSYIDPINSSNNKADIQITGILTSAETTEYKSWSNTPTWTDTITRIEKQQKKLFKAALLDVFKVEMDKANKEDNLDRKTALTDAETLIREGDISIPFDQIADGTADPNTAAPKRVAFLNVFLPYLRQELTHRFVVDTLSSSVGLEREVTDTLISKVLMYGSPAAPIYAIFEKIKDNANPVTGSWTGYLIPSAEQDYTFIVKNGSTTLPPSLNIDGTLLIFEQQEDPNNEWWSKPQKLQAGKLYALTLTGSDLKNVFWKTPTSTITAVPPSVLLPDFASAEATPAYILLKKASLLVSGFNLSADEIRYFNTHQSDFDGLKFYDVSLKQWLRLEAYTRLRNSLPETKTNILSFFNWTTTISDPLEKTKLSAKIVELTLWKKENIDKLIKAKHFNLDDTTKFYNEINLLKLQHAVSVADKIGMDIDQLFDWAKPTSNFKKCRNIADSIEKAIRAQYNQTDWEAVIKPLHDKLRNNQKDALIAYLLQKTELQTWGVTDADGLFEYFLIDVQMDACMETSRIKQGISSLQLFIMRCFLGLKEEHNGIKPNVLDRDRWYWMERYRVWEANRKVFLYPENWIESNLRDDKSPFFKELESELLQKDINKQNVTDALKNYLYKVDEVANMEVIGLYIDGTRPNGKWTEGAKLHVFARTRNAPYFFYYRYLALDEMNWYAWEKMQVDIPSYDVEDSNGFITSNGCYLIPVVWNGRLLIFFPQFMKKTKPVSNGIKSFQTIASEPQDNVKPIEYWEIKMAWSEYRNGKWTQKQLSKAAINDDGSGRLPSLGFYEFVPVLSTAVSNPLLGIRVFHTYNTDSGTFEFDGNSIQTPLQTYTSNNNIFPNIFHHSVANLISDIRSLQISTEVINHKFTNNNNPTNNNNATFYNSIPFYNPYTNDLLGKINTGQLEAFFRFNTEGVITPAEKAEAYGLFDPDDNSTTLNSVYHELKRPYSLYNWELFFHTPMLLADALSKAQHFEEAMKWFHFVFNPIAKGEEDNRFWAFSPFKDTNSQRILDSIFNNLQPNQTDKAINEWRNKPFMPHVVARSRPVAYMKWVVMKYIDNLVAWGDYLFHQDTIESINQATQLYVLANHILGKRPMLIPKRGKTKPQTYLSLLDKWDAFGNAMVELELVAPYSNQITTATGSDSGVVGLANVFGFSTALYFCIPNNPKLTGYWDTIDDRLFKIRHCQNIEGIFRKLPLFEPPIDPALLVKAAAQGLSIASVLNDLNTPMPNYRFYYLLQKALELCGELKSLGGAMLSAIEKKDNETIALMRAKHESVMHNLVMEVKKLQLEEAQKSLETLQQNRIAPVERMKYYLKLSGIDESAVPSENTAFSGLANDIVTVDGDSGLKLIPFEKEDMDKSHEAADWQTGIGVVETLSSILHALPTINSHGTPLGVGVAVSWGFPNLANAVSAVGRGLRVHADHLSYQSSNAGKKGGFTRAIQERIQQANAAGYEIKQIDMQITAQKIRIQMANLEITNQQKQIDNAQEVEEFLKNKYTNEELYTWMRGSLKTLYHQVYSLAYDLAKKAEKTYRFERGLSNSNFIQSGYWDAGREGLLAGEQLYVGLKQLEAAYQENRGYDYEITKHISLRQINPIAVLQLKETGKCEFMLPEVLFDMDFPNHFKRRIKSVSLSIPCVAGPYTNINATLRLLENKFRNTALAKDKNDYPEKTEETDERFSSFIIPISAIAASSAQNDGGMFELNFKDERYLPFEGAGVISKWRLELPQFRQFDYDTISDVVVHLRYISTEGGERLKKAAYDSAQSFMSSIEELGQQEGLFSIIDLQHDLPTEWHKAMQTTDADGYHRLDIKKVQEFMPYFSKTKDGKPRAANTVAVTDVIVFGDPQLQQGDIKLDFDGNSTDDYNDLSLGTPIGGTKTFTLSETIHKLEQWKLKFKQKPNPIDKAFMLIRFTLKK